MKILYFREQITVVTYAGPGCTRFIFVGDLHPAGRFDPRNIYFRRFVWSSSVKPKQAKCAWSSAGSTVSSLLILALATRDPPFCRLSARHFDIHAGRTHVHLLHLKQQRTGPGSAARPAGRVHVPRIAAAAKQHVRAVCGRQRAAAQPLRLRQRHRRSRRLRRPSAGAAEPPASAAPSTSPVRLCRFLHVEAYEANTKRHNTKQG